MRITKGNGKTIGGLRSPMAAPSKGLIKKGTLNPAIAANTMRPGLSTAGARVRSAQTGGKVVKPF